MGCSCIKWRKTWKQLKINQNSSMLVCLIFLFLLYMFWSKSTWQSSYSCWFTVSLKRSYICKVHKSKQSNRFMTMAKTSPVHYETFNFFMDIFFHYIFQVSNIKCRRNIGSKKFMQVFFPVNIFSVNFL